MKKFDPNKYVQQAQDAVTGSYEQEMKAQKAVDKAKATLEKAQDRLSAAIDARAGAVKYLTDNGHDVPEPPADLQATTEPTSEVAAESDAEPESDGTVIPEQEPVVDPSAQFSNR